MSQGTAKSPRVSNIRGATAGSLAEVGATLSHRTPERAAAPPAASLYAGLPMPVLGTTSVDHDRMPEWTLGPFEFPCTLLLRAERPPTPSQLWAMPAMFSTQTIMITTVTSRTVATPATTMWDWSNYPLYTSYAPSTGLASAPPMRPAVAASQYLPTLIDTTEVSPETWTGSAGCRAEFGDQDLEAVSGSYPGAGEHTSGQLPTTASIPSSVGLEPLVEPRWRRGTFGARRALSAS